MKILSHRGYWLESYERNQCAAFERSFRLGFGTETDLRDFAGKVVISHDVPTGEMLAFSAFLEIHKKQGQGDLPLALNIKADGLASMVKEALSAFAEIDAFVFDMSVPDMRAYFDAGVPVFTRMSEVEKQPSWLERSAGIWLDCFDSDWFDSGVVRDLLATGKRICVVSPELHQRDPLPVWELLRMYSSAENLLLCTDRPEQARDFLRVDYER